jgi:hypothetical protein
VFLPPAAQTSRCPRAPGPKRAQQERARKPKHSGTFSETGPELTERLPNELNRLCEVVLEERDGSAYNAIAEPSESGIPPRILLDSAEVRGVVHFDDELSGWCAKVHNVEPLRRTAQDDLAPKADTELRALQGVPEECLIVRRMKPHVSGEALNASEVFLSAVTRIRSERSETSRTGQSGPFRPAEEPGTRPFRRRSRESGAVRALTKLDAPLARLVRRTRWARLFGRTEVCAPLVRWASPSVPQRGHAMSSASFTTNEVLTLRPIFCSHSPIRAQLRGSATQRARIRENRRPRSEARRHRKRAPRDLIRNYYDAEGNKAIAVHPGATSTEEVAFHGGDLSIRVNSTGAYVTKHIYAGSERLASKMDASWFTSSPIQYYVTDHLGSAQYTLDGHQNLLSHTEYFPSGKRHWVHWRLKSSKFPRQTFVEWAALTIPRSYWASELLQGSARPGSHPLGRPSRARFQMGPHPFSLLEGRLHLRRISLPQAPQNPQIATHHRRTNS